MYDSYIGIDYSGAETAESRLKGLAVYQSNNGDEPRRVSTPDARPHGPQKWSRRVIAEWLVEQLYSKRIIVGIDHCFSLPDAWYERQGIRDWKQMLNVFPRLWPTHHNTYVDFLWEIDGAPPPGGIKDELRITETWTPSAKSVFRFDGPGAVGKSSWAGIPWLAHIRKEIGDRVHFWPFDGWTPPENKSVIAEIYPSMFSRRYPREDRNSHEHDAYAVSRWLSEMDRTGRLEAYFHPQLTDDERRIAETIEGWVLGVM